MKITDENNIVLLVLDTLSANHLPFYGYERETAPFLSSLSKDNAVFENAYSTGPWTIPSHGTIFSGKQPREHGATSESMFFSSDSFVEILSKRGYSTYGISNNHLISKDLGFSSGFDYFEEDKGIYFESEELKALKTIWQIKSNDELSNKAIIDFIKDSIRNRDFNSFTELGKYGIKRLIDKGYDFDSYLSMEDNGAKYTNRIIRRELSDEPFFLFVNYMEPHEPYNPPKKIAEKWIRDVGSVKKQYEKKMYGRPSFRKEVDAELEEGVKALYDAEIRYLDNRLEEIYNYIEKKFENTVFIIVGDHGEMLGEHGMWGHQHGVWQKLVHVPLIVAGEGVESQRVEKTVSLTELREFIEGKIGLSEIGSEQALAEYYGLKGFVVDYGEKEISDYEEKEMPYLLNTSKAVFSREKGFVRNSQLKDYRFPPNLSSNKLNELKNSLDGFFKEEFLTGVDL